MSPDPAGLAAVDPSNPQSWNRYSYVGNNPLNSIDPFGLDGICLAQLLDGGCLNGPADPGLLGGIDDAGLPVGGGVDPPLDANAGDPGSGIAALGLTESCAASSCYFSNLFPDSAPTPTSVDSGLSQTDTLGADSSLGGDLLPNVPLNSFEQGVDDRANALAHALNKTGVQSLGNPCTVASFYAASAIGGTLGGFAVGGEVRSQVVEAVTTYWPQALSQGYNRLYRQVLRGGPVANFILNIPKNYNKAKAAVLGGCNAMQ
jgi:hypothetical protein